MTLATLRSRRDTAANWAASNPILSLGEIGWETDTNKGKVGDGSTTWNSLTYTIGGGAAATTTISVTQAPYLATGNGTTDDTTAIHAARTAAGAGGSIFFPPGTYKTTGLTASLARQEWVLAPGASIVATGVAHTITISASNVSITGLGKIDAGSGSAFSGVFVSAGLTDILVRGVEVINGTYGVRCKGGTGAVTSRLKVNGCSIHGTSSHGVFFNWETQDSEVSGNNIYSVTGNGVWVGNTSLRCRITNNSIISSGRNGIEVFGGSYGATVTGNALTTIATIGITLDSSDGSRVANNRVDTVTTSYGIELAASNKCVVEANNIKSVGSVGVSISAPSGTCDDNTVANNIIDTPGTNGIFAGGSANGAKRLRVIGNEIVDSANSNSAIGCATGIGCTDWVISGNTVRWTSATSSLAGSTGIGLDLPNTLVIGNLIVADGAITTAGATAINLPSTAIDCTVVGNTVLANSKINKGIVVNASVTGALIATNRITNTMQDIINCAATSTTNQISNNSGTAAAGSGYTFTNARQFGNATTTGSTNFGFSTTTGTTAPGAGAAGALPATPAGYATVTINGTSRQIAYY